MSFQTKSKKSLCEFSLPSGFQHLAVIMDGNGRWAKQRGWPRHFGHIRGVRALHNMIDMCSRLKVPYLSVFAFSTENWKRSSEEVSVIMKLMKKSLNKYKNSLHERNIRLSVLGSLEELDKNVQELFYEVMDYTKNNTGLRLIVAVNYGGRREIVEAVRKLTQKLKEGSVGLEDINESSLSEYLASSSFPPPDLIIRTGNVSRLSNFYLWHSAYSELYVSPLLWPDFNNEELLKALQFYAQTQRRFGAAPPI